MDHTGVWRSADVRTNLRPPLQLYFSGRLIGPFQTRFAERVCDDDELACDCCDDNLVWLSRGSQAVSEGFQDRIVMAERRTDGASGPLFPEVPW